ncbi:MAG: hypothetical protein RMZ69_21555 [Nostoc sp. ChiQUE01a]|nr:hypothetical protein [Nostoc sp. ChiQUE01a]
MILYVFSGIVLLVDFQKTTTIAKSFGGFLVFLGDRNCVVNAIAKTKPPSPLLAGRFMNFQ